jgi:hypothetical protein
MTETTVYLSSLFKEKKFNDIIEYVNSSSISFDEYYTALKINSKNLFKNKAFWHSPVSILFIGQVIISPLKINFYQSYLSSNSNFSPRLTEKLLELNTDDFKLFFKLNRCYDMPDFMHYLNELCKKFKFFWLPLLLQELETVQKAESAIQMEESNETIKLLTIPFDKVLLGICGLHEHLMQSEYVTNNTDGQTMYDMAIVREANNIIRLFYSNSGLKIQINFSTSANLESEWDKMRPSHKYENRKEPHLDDDYKYINQILNNRIDRQSTQYWINNYIAGFADFKDPFQISTLNYNETHKRYKINDYKSRFEELYFLNTKDITSKNVSHKASLDLFKFYDIPEITITSDGKQFHLDRAYKLLQDFSDYKSPLGFNFSIHGNDMKKQPINESQKEFKASFGPHEHISYFQLDNLIVSISKYYEWPETETKELIDQLSIDLLNTQDPKDYLSNPFLKVNDTVYWLGRLNKKRRWDVILRNKLRFGHFLDEKSRQSIGKNLETSVSDLFESVGYKPLPKEFRDFFLQSGEKGEMDYLGYKDGEVIIIEVKSGGIIEESDVSVQTETLRLEGEAAEQLEKDNKYLTEAWNAKLRSYFKTEKDYNDLTILSLIVTDFFEGDLRLYKSQYHKTTLLELDVILKNQKEQLIDMTGLFSSLINSNNPEYKKDKKNNKWDLHNGKKNVSIEIIRNCLENNLIWRDLEEIKKF